MNTSAASKPVPDPDPKSEDSLALSRDGSTPENGDTSAAVLPAPPEEAFVESQAPPVPRRKQTFVEKIEAFISHLSTRNNFWHRLCSLFWLPYAFRSGIQMKQVKVDGKEEGFTAVLPFRRFNRNWYNAMAGASLLANSEIAGGMYVFQKAGRDYTVVCKELSYRFLRPCFGPAVYQAIPLADIDALVAGHKEFNIDIQLNVYQQLKAPGQDRQKRVGRVKATFHVTPKVHHKEKRERTGR